MNDDDYFLRGTKQEWRAKDPARARAALEECKRLLAPYLPTDTDAANDEDEGCRHLYVDSERHLHTQECKHCGDIREHPAKFYAEQKR